MEIICLDDAAFYALIDKVVQHIKEKHKIIADPYISAEEAMKVLRISSKTTLQKLRDERKIDFFQDGKQILYRTQSIKEYLEKNTKKSL